MNLKKYSVTIRKFDSQQGAESGEDFVLPVDSPDEEHAVASTMSDAISFSTRTSRSEVLPVAFCCVKIEARKDPIL